MLDSALTHASKFTKSRLKDKGFVGYSYMAWPSKNCDLNLTENLYSILKREVYCNWRQFKSKNDLWEAVKADFGNVSVTNNTNLASDADNMLLSVTAKIEGLVY